MTEKKSQTPAEVRIDGRLYDRLLAYLKAEEHDARYRDVFELPEARGRFREGMSIAQGIYSRGRQELANELERLIADDWCEDDGDGYCGNHQDWVAYHVDIKGKLLKPGTFDPEEDGFPICPRNYKYDPKLDR